MHNTLLILAISQEDVFRSIGSNVGGEYDSSRVVLLLAAIVLLVLLLAALSQRHKRQVAPPPLNNPRKLIRQVTAALELKPAELKRLRALAEAVSQQKDRPIQNPLTLLLCPSLLSAGKKQRPQK